MKAAQTQVFHFVSLHSAQSTERAGPGFNVKLTRNNGKQAAPGRVDVLGKRSLTVK